MSGAAAKSQYRPTTNAEGQYSNESAVLLNVELLAWTGSADGGLMEVASGKLQLNRRTDRQQMPKVR